ncbi:NDR1/HIN1-like protein 6 [Impatiens glandulifera]|uniref:NDR1/HIN1-like protein 6 n=1 Tax=Impatiens glandulifera TaxID=253017 RepID=UPI001FB12C97|nr:NDR1/HIN1-like protein 6 [Impatiens glandulifera]
MTDPQKIHPLVETPPARPLIPAGSSGSEKAGDPETGRFQPNNKKIRRNCCRRCICWTLITIILLIVLIGITILTLYLVFKPKIPQYSVDKLRISDLTLNLDGTLYAKFNVRITAINPNEKIGIHYEKGSRLSVWYEKTSLCRGTLPAFFQGPRMKAVLDVALEGRDNYAGAAMSAIGEAQRTGSIPLRLKVEVPVRVQMGGLKVKRVRVLGNCLVVVDSLSPNSLISIKHTNCKYKLKL